jgi:5-methyltetrahydrofolate--homocysteine methyltransferase
MSEYQITYWREIPTMVTARAGRANSAKVQLDSRFMVAVDAAAMRLGLTGSDAYMEQWRKGPWEPSDGEPADLAATVAAELEAEYDAARLRAMLLDYAREGQAAGVAQPPTNPEPSRTAANADNPLFRRLLAGEIVVGDGAMGTMLQASGLTDGGAPEPWNVTEAEKVKAIYRGYAEAGSQIITSNTFGGTSARLKMHNLQDRVREFNRAGVQLAREVADEFGVLVAGDIGPSGELIEPVGPLSLAEAQAMFAEQIRGLVEGDPDFLLIETMSHLNEVEAAVRAAQEVAPELPVAATLSFDTNYHTMMGVSPRQAVETLASWGVRVIGANCGNGPAEIETVMTQMAQHRPEGVFLMAQANAGLPQYKAGAISYDGTPDVMADYALRLRGLGINVIGACCGSTPTHIAAMAQALATAKNAPIAGPPAAQSESIESAESRADRAASRRAARRTRTDA